MLDWSWSPGAAMTKWVFSFYGDGSSRVPEFSELLFLHILLIIINNETPARIAARAGNVQCTRLVHLEDEDFSEELFRQQSYAI